MSSETVNQDPPSNHHPRRTERVSFSTEEPLLIRFQASNINTRSESVLSDTSEPEFIDKNLRSLSRRPSIFPSDSSDRSPNATGRRSSKWRNSINNITYHLHEQTFFDSSKHIGTYWRNIMLLYETIDEELKFPILPEKAESLNHLSAQLWLVTFSMTDLVDDLAETKEITKLNEAYAKVIYEAKQTEEFIQDLKEPLVSLKETANELFKSMNQAIFGSEESSNPASTSNDTSNNTNANANSNNSTFYEGDATKADTNNLAKTPETELSDQIKSDPINQTTTADSSNSNNINKTSELTPKSATEALLCGSKLTKILLFERIDIYTRTTAKRKWYLFNTIPYEQKLKIVHDALNAVTESLITLRNKFKPVLKTLKDGSYRRCFFCKANLIKHLRNMKSSLLQITSSPDFTEYLSSNETKMMTDIRRNETYIKSIVDNGKQLVCSIQEVHAMTELCFIYLVDGLSIPFKPCEDVLMLLYKNFNPKNVTKFRNYASDDFFKTRYPDVLRKVPIVIQRTELSLHKRTKRSMMNVATIAQHGVVRRSIEGKKDGESPKK